MLWRRIREEFTSGGPSLVDWLLFLALVAVHVGTSVRGEERRVGHDRRPALTAIRRGQPARSTAGSFSRTNGFPLLFTLLALVGLSRRRSRPSALAVCLYFLAVFRNLSALLRRQLQLRRRREVFAADRTRRWPSSAGSARRDLRLARRGSAPRVRTRCRDCGALGFQFLWYAPARACHDRGGLGGQGGRPVRQVVCELSCLRMPTS